MKTKNLLIAAAISGSLAAYPLAGSASQSQDRPGGPAMEKQACSGKSGCAGKDKQEDGKKKKKKSKKKSKDKNACNGKSGCAGKDKQS